MTKRQIQAQIKAEETLAVAMYLRGKTLKQIKQRTSVPGWVVKGLVIAKSLSR
jgi:hypothetical protein